MDEQISETREGSTIGHAMPEPVLREAIDRKQSRQFLLREYNVNIRFLSIGCVVEVGCRSIPFTSVDEAMTELTEYIKDPSKSIEKWNKIFNEG